MALRDRFRRVMPTPSLSSSSSSLDKTESHATTATTVNTLDTSSEASFYKPATRQPPQQQRFTLPWSRSSREREQRREEKEEKKRKKRIASGKPIHPRDKPLTETNLRHQEMLSAFDFSFGSSPSRRSQVVLPLHDGVSPCCTRPPSIDGLALDGLVLDDHLDPGAPSTGTDKI